MTAALDPGSLRVASRRALRRVAWGVAAGLLAAACSLASLDAYDEGGATSGTASSSGTTSGASSGSSSGGINDAGPEAAPPDASCATANGACVESPPVGWTGPFAFYEGSAANAPACPAGFPVAVDAHEGLAAVPSAQCAACACGNAAGFTCQGPATMHLFSDTSCQTSCGSLSIPAAGCGPTVSGGCASAVAFTLTSADATGTCTPSGGAATLPPLTWATAARGCTPPSSPRDCPSGKLCAPVPPAPFGATMCIAQSGDIPCPAGAYSQKHTAFDGASDTRACGACSCGAATATCGNFDLNPGGDCFGPFFFQNAPLPIKCSAAPTGGMYSFDYAATPNAGGPCAALGGQPQGSATPQGPVTICCAM